MKRIISMLLVFAVVFSMVGCSNNSKKLVSEKYYLASLLGDGYGAGAVVMKFEDNGTVHIVDSGLARPQDKRKNYYATYSVEESSLTIKYSDEEYNGVILEEGQKISFGEKVFKQVELSDLAKETAVEFK